MKISKKKLREMILQELRYAGTGAVAAQDDTFGQESLYKMDKYGQYFVKIYAILDQCVGAITNDIKSGELPRNLSVHNLTNLFELLEDNLARKKDEIVRVETAVRGKINANVND